MIMMSVSKAAVICLSRVFIRCTVLSLCAVSFHPALRKVQIYRRQSLCLLSLSSEEGKGTTVEVRFPFDKRRLALG